jgi:hypothetical protein
MSEHRFRKGDLVEFQFGKYSFRGTVKEDRGPLGIKGRNLYLVEFCFDLPSDGLSQIELPAERLRLVQEKVTKE